MSKDKAADIWAIPVPTRQAVSITGRRLVLYPFGQGTEGLVAHAMQEKSVSGFLNLTTSFVREYAREVSEETGEEVAIDNYARRMLMQEEFDLLFLLRYVSYGHLFPFIFTCPHCQYVTDEPMELDLSRCRRYLIECSDEACECHEVNELCRETPDEEYHNFDFMSQHWTGVDPDHLEHAPPRLVYRPSSDMSLQRWSREAYEGLEFHFAFPTVSQKLRLATHSDDDNPEQVRVWLEETIRRIVWPRHGIDTQGERERDTRRDTRRVLRQIKEEALRMCLRSFLERKTGGLDARVRIVCPNPVCRQAVLQRVPVGKEFFMPVYLQTR